MYIEIELLGYKGRLTHIIPRTAYPPWYPEERLLVNVDFDKPAESIISTAIAIPVKQYSRDEFLKVVKKEGEKQLAVTLAEDSAKREKYAQERARKEELETFAASLQASIEKEFKD